MCGPGRAGRVPYKYTSEPGGRCAVVPFGVVSRRRWVGRSVGRAGGKPLLLFRSKSNAYPTTGFLRSVPVTAEGAEKTVKPTHPAFRSRSSGATRIDRPAPAGRGSPSASPREICQPRPIAADRHGTRFYAVRNANDSSCTVS